MNDSSLFNIDFAPNCYFYFERKCWLTAAQTGRNDLLKRYNSVRFLDEDRNPYGYSKVDVNLHYEILTEAVRYDKREVIKWLCKKIGEFLASTILNGKFYIDALDIKFGSGEFFDWMSSENPFKSIEEENKCRTITGDDKPYESNL